MQVLKCPRKEQQRNLVPLSSLLLVCGIIFIQKTEKTISKYCMGNSIQVTLLLRLCFLLIHKFPIIFLLYAYFSILSCNHTIV